MNRKNDPLREQRIRRDLQRTGDEIQMDQAVPRRMPEPASPTNRQVRDAVAVYFEEIPPPPGPSPTPEQIAAAVAAYLSNNPPLKGDTGPSSKVALGTVTLAQTATAAIAAGDRNLTFAVAGAKLGDDLLLFPAAAMPTGYTIKSVVATANGTVSVRITAPMLAIGNSYSIPCRLVALR